MNRKFRISAAALCAAAIFGLGANVTAYAAPDPAPVGNAAIIDANAGVELSIHKYLGDPAGGKNDGTVVTPAPALPALNGVNFDVYEVAYADGTPIDLTTNAGWTAAAAISGHTPSQVEITAGQFTIGGVTYRITKDGTATTAGTGTADYKPVGGIGLYLVNENLGTSGTITNATTGATVVKSTITGSAPFFVTLPMTHPTDLNTWMYSVNVYPKNQVDSIEKAVTDATTHKLGDALNYTLTSSIPSGTIDLYVVGDSNQYAQFSGVEVSVGGATLTGCDATAGPGAGCDYYYWLDKDASATGSQLVVQMSTAGIAKLVAAKAADAGAMVTTTIDGAITSLPADGSGQVPNSAWLIPSENWWDSNVGTTPPETPDPNTPPVTPPTEPETPPTSNEVVSYFGDITVTKNLVNPAQGDVPAGAEFAIFVDPTPGDACSAADVSAPAQSLQTLAVATGETSVTFQDYRASNWAGNKEITAADPGFLQYCIVETKAPAGYNLNAQPVTIVLDYKTGTATTQPFAETTINNEKTNLGNELPLTGGEGVVAISLAGLALIGGGTAYYVMGNRRRREEA